MNTTYDPRQDDPMHDDNITQEQFEKAATMNSFPTITIPDPAAVGKWLDEQLPGCDKHRVHYGTYGFTTCHWYKPAFCYDIKGDTPEALLADIRRQLAENEPLEKLRKEWIAAGRPQLD